MSRTDWGLVGLEDGRVLELYPPTCRGDVLDDEDHQEPPRWS